MPEIIPSPADIVTRVFHSLKLGTDPGENGQWPIFVNVEPNEPDDVITVQDTEGAMEGRLQFPGTISEKPGIQIRIRSRNPNPSKPYQIRDAMDQTIRNNTVKVSGINYKLVSVSRQSNVISIGRDGNNGLFLFVINAQVTL